MRVYAMLDGGPWHEEIINFSTAGAEPPREIRLAFEKDEGGREAVNCGVYLLAAAFQLPIASLGMSAQYCYSGNRRSAQTLIAVWMQGGMYEFPEENSATEDGQGQGDPTVGG